MIRIQFRAALGSCLALALCACGGGQDSANAVDNSAGTVEAAATGDGSAEAASQGTVHAQRLNCSTINAQRGEGPDVVGVTIGMPAELAFQKVACSDPTLVVDMRMGPAGARAGIEARSDSQRTQVFLDGPPGQERVINIIRALSFTEGEQPALAATMAQLESKYGRLLRFLDGSDPISLYVMRGADGTLFTNSDDQLFNTCVNSSMEAGCGGLELHVNIYPARQNAELVGRMDVFLDHHRYAVQQREAANQQARASDDQRRKQEVEAASGRRPTL